jgi:hypothetical protein
MPYTVYCVTAVVNVLYGTVYCHLYKMLGLCEIHIYILQSFRVLDLFTSVLRQYSIYQELVLILAKK